MLPKLTLNIERWKYNKTFELYVSNMGHIRNKSKADIAPKIMNNGYMVVYVNGSINGYMLLHRVVMLTWKSTPEAEHLTVDHLDHNKRNNALSNLEWVTYAENQRRAKEDLIGTCCPEGCEYIKALHFDKGIAKMPSMPKPDPNSKTSQKKARSKAYFEKMSHCIGFKLVSMKETASGKKIFGKNEIFVANTLKGYAKFEKLVKNHGGIYTLCKQKFDDMLNGSNRTEMASVLSYRITPVFDSFVAEEEN